MVFFTQKLASHLHDTWVLLKLSSRKGNILSDVNSVFLGWEKKFATTKCDIGLKLNVKKIRYKVVINGWIKTKV